MSEEAKMNGNGSEAEAEAEAEVAVELTPVRMNNDKEDKEEGAADQTEPPAEPVNTKTELATAEETRKKDIEAITQSGFGGDRPKGFLGNNRAAVLEWDNVEFRVKEKGKVKTILREVSGASVPGKMLALMGPSGAGKSSLLNILACRTVSTRSKSIEVTGEVRCNGAVVDPNTFRSEVAYVMQDDVMYAHQTPREAFRFSARLRLSQDKSVEERNELVEFVIKVLGLEKCADTKIGSIKVAGISGGERKRTAIGIELISSPSILFLDEPTSGLDSYAAHNVVKVLTELSIGGCTVIATIHQPSSEVFALFSDTLLLANGRSVFNGSTQAMLPHFAGLNHVCPPNYNPADFVMFLMQKQTAEELDHLANEWDTAAATQPKPSAELIKQAQLSLAVADKFIKPNCCIQLGWLSQRTFTNFGRNTGSLIARLMITIFQNLIVAFVFFGIGRDYESIGEGLVPGPNTSSIIVSQLQSVSSAHFGILFFVSIGALFGLAQPLLLNFPVERPIFLREHATGTYGAVPYFLSAMFVEIPVGILQMALVYVCTYWTVGLHGNFAWLVLATAMVGFVAASTALVIGALVSNVESGIQAAPLTFVPQILFAGFFIPIALIPEWLRWAQYLCSLKYGINMLLVVEFSDLPGSWNPDLSEEYYWRAVYGCAEAVTNCDDRVESALFPRNEIEKESMWLYVLIMFAIFVVFRTVAAIVLAVRSKSSI